MQSDFNNKNISANKIAADKAPEESISTSWGDGPLFLAKIWRHSSATAQRVQMGTDRERIGRERRSCIFSVTAWKHHRSEHTSIERIKNSIKCAALRTK